MAVRTTATEVKEIMDNCTTSDSIVTSLIIAASSVVDKDGDLMEKMKETNKK